MYNYLFKQTWKLEWANEAIESSKLYMAIATPGDLKSNTLSFSTCPFWSVKTNSN